jgi:hypothetical protein
MNIALIFIVLFLTAASGSASLALPVAPAQPPSATPTAPEHVILFVLEGVDQKALKTGSMSVLSRLIRDGAATWSAETIAAPHRLPAMASLLTGLPVQKHGITWDAFEFSRGYPRPPTIFDYLDLSGGRDSAIFFMDESLYQLAKPEPYTDYQMCGPLKPECSPERVVAYIQQYFRKAMSGQGYGHAILGVPHLLVVHLPAGGRAGVEHGWHSKDYRTALRSVDHAMGSVLDIFNEHGLLPRTTVFVTSLSGTGAGQGSSAPVSSRVPWIASGVGIKAGHAIRQPVSIVDTGATVMRSLGLDTHMEWDSRVVEEIFRDTIAGSALPTKGR